MTRTERFGLPKSPFAHELPNSEPIPLSDGEITEELKVLYPQGSTLRELAERYETSEETIRRLMIAAGIPRRPRGQPLGKI